MKPGVKPNSLADCAVLVCATVVSRFICRSHYLYDIDSVNFALGMDHFAPALHQPHPPGYYLYVCAGRAVNVIFGDANASLVALSILASAAAGVFLYLLARDWFGRQAARFAGGLFLISPLCWFHGTVALTYIVETFFSAMTGYLCWRAYSGEGRKIIPAAVALGLAAGFRPSSLIFLGPLWLFSLWKTQRRYQVIACALLGATLLAWGIPMLNAAGGPTAYLAPLWNLWKLIPARQTVAGAWAAMLLVRMITIAGIAALCFGGASFVAFRPVPPASLKAGLRVFIYVWIAPGLAFFSLVFLLFVNSGYLLVLSPPVFAWMGFHASECYARNSYRKLPRAVLLGATAAVNIGLFLFAPLYCSFREVRKFEADLSRVTTALRHNFDPQETIIVGFDSHFLGYRHAAFYLPEFFTVQYPPVLTPDGVRIFAVSRRRTELLRDLPSGPYTRFVLFPLPGDAGAREYANRQRARFPQGALQVRGDGGTAFFTGMLTDLHYLFSESPRNR